jgi:predicted metalloprotease with PDZ domain
MGVLVDIRRKTQQQKSLDDVMRLLYQRYYHELQRGFTEEEFWSACAEVAGEPLTEVRHLVDTTDDIPYDDYLTDAGLRIDTTSWAILPVENPTPAQQQFLRAMSLEE